MDFLKKFKRICDEIDNSMLEVTSFTPVVVEKTESIKYPVKLFNIYKRSLPPGINKIVVFNVPKADAETLINHASFNHVHLMADKAYQDDARESKTIVYYDIIPVDAEPRERSIYFNPPETRHARYGGLTGGR